MQRHEHRRKPTTALQYARRAYERCVQLTALLTKVEAQFRLDQEARTRCLATMETQAGTIARLLRQHDTLRRMPSWPQMERELIAANAYIAEPLKPGAAKAAIPTLTVVAAENAAPAPSGESTRNDFTP
jgi:hypothetical protein